MTHLFFEDKEIPFQCADQLNGPAYYKTCPVVRRAQRSRFKYFEYSTHLTVAVQLSHSRTMTHHALIFHLEGEVHLTIDGCKDVLIRPGDIYFLHRGAEIGGYIEGEIAFVSATVERELTSRELEDLRKIRSHAQFDKYEFKPLRMNKQMLEFAQTLKGHLSNGVSCPHLHEAKSKELYVILHWYYSLADNAQLFYQMVSSVSEFRGFIIENYRTSVSIDELVAKSNMSRSTFDRKFKETFAMTPHKWIDEHTRQVIIDKSSEPNVTVKDVMYEVGIYNSSQFTKLCKRICGRTPSELIRSA